MAEILTQRALVLAEIEAVFGVMESPSASTDALLVEEPDFTADINRIQRTFARQSISQLPSAAGRKLGQMTFMHEVRGNGDLTTAPRIGRLLRACGFTQTQVSVNGTAVNGRVDVVADTNNGGPVVTWAAAGTNAIIRDLGYRVRVVLGGASATARVRVTGGAVPEDQQTDVSQEKDAVLTETFTFEIVSGTTTGTVVIDDTTDPQTVTYNVAGLSGATLGDVYRVTVLGIPFLVTLSSGTATTNIADDIAAAVDAHPAFVAPNPAASVVSVTFAGAATAVVVTTAVTALTLGASGHTIVPSWAGSLVLNDNFTATTRPIGWEYTPISTGFESITIFMYFDGVLHRLSGARGTFTVEGEAGALAKFSFTFTGNYNPVIDAAIPAATFETQIPQQVELANLVVNEDVDATSAETGIDSGASWENQINGEFIELCAQSFGLDAGNAINPRDCMNETDGYNGVVLTGREMSGTMNPELELVEDHDFWGLLSTADILHQRVRVGSTRANIVRFESDGAQYVGLAYADRNGLRVLDVELAYSATAPDFSDDEFLIAFN